MLLIDITVALLALTVPLVSAIPIPATDPTTPSTTPAAPASSGINIPGLSAVSSIVGAAGSVESSTLPSLTGITSDLPISSLAGPAAGLAAPLSSVVNPGPVLSTLPSLSGVTGLVTPLENAAENAAGPLESTAESFVPPQVGDVASEIPSLPSLPSLPLPVAVPGV